MSLIMENKASAQYHKPDEIEKFIFSYEQRYKEAEIVTAYPSSDWQIKLYKRKRK